MVGQLRVQNLAICFMFYEISSNAALRRDIIVQQDYFNMFDSFQILTVEIFPNTRTNYLHMSTFQLHM